MNNPIHALIIEDDNTNVDVLAEFFGLMGVSFTAITNPLEIDLKLPPITSIHIVFLDLEMPYLNGYEVFNMLRQRWEVQVPIVAYSAHINEMDTARLLGFNSFIAKPVSIARFPTQFHQILAGESIWDSY